MIPSPRLAGALALAVAIATVSACTPRTVETSQNELSNGPDASPVDLDLDLATPADDPFGIADLSTVDLDAEITALKGAGTYHDLTPQQRARYKALARRRAHRRSSAPVEAREPGANAYAGDPATPPKSEEVAP